MESGSESQALVPAGQRLLKSVAGRAGMLVPRVIAAAGAQAARRFLEFFAATIRNKNTRMTTFEQLSAFSRPGSVHYICIDWRHLREFLGAAGAKTYGDLLNLCVWVKSNGGMGHRNNVELGRHGRNRTNVWVT